ncbi:MAG TPA: hypothetical protein EYP10_02690 [Armatimonadetes bacterium]|nr:hypothetical protein [Armatimonadota bacterium]
MFALTGMRKSPYIFAGFIICLVGTFIRLWGLGYQSFWLDEAFACVNALKPLSNIMSVDLANPPLHIATLHFWLALARNDAWARLLSAIFGIISLWVTWKLASEVADERVGVLTALICAFSGFHIYYSQETRMYGMLVGLISILALATWRIAQSWDARWGGAFIASGTLTAYTHFTSVGILLPCSLWLAWRIIKRRLPHRWLIVAVLPWILSIPAWFQAIFLAPHHGMAKAGLQLSKSIACILIAWFDFNANYWLGLGGELGATIPIVLVVMMLQACVALYYLSVGMRRLNPMARYWIASMFILPNIIYAMLATVTKWGRTKYAICALPFFIILIAVGLSAHRRRFSPYVSVFLALTIGLNLLSLWNYFFNPAFHHPDWRAAVPIIEERFKNGDIILAPRWHEYLIKWYARKTLPVQTLQDLMSPQSRLSQRTGFERARIWIIEPKGRVGSDESHSAQEYLKGVGYKVKWRWDGVNISVHLLTPEG